MVTAAPARMRIIRPRCQRWEYDTGGGIVAKPASGDNAAVVPADRCARQLSLEHSCVTPPGIAATQPYPTKQLHSNMAAIFDKLGIRFLYPENWKLDESEALEGNQVVTVYSPGESFWSIMIHPADGHAREAGGHGPEGDAAAIRRP